MEGSWLASTPMLLAPWTTESAISVCIAYLAAEPDLQEAACFPVGSRGRLQRRQMLTSQSVPSGMLAGSHSSCCGQ